MIRKMTFGLALVCSLCAVGFSEEWRQFRGPDGQGHSAATNLPLTWSESENVVWKTPLPGRAWSSPVFSGQTIWLSTAVENKLSGEALEKAREAKLGNKPLADQMALVGAVVMRVVSVDAGTGKVLSDTELATVNDPPEIHSLNSYASPTPALSKDGVLVCHFGELGTFGFDTVSGKLLWRKVLPAVLAVGAGSSPVIYEDLVLIPCDGTDQQYVVGLNTRTGEQVWKTKRPPMSGSESDFHKAYASPLLVRAAGRDQLISPGAQWVVSYNPATGEELWRVRHGDGFSNAPCPVMIGDRVCINTGFMKPEFLAIRPDGEGDVTETHVAWRISKQVPTMPSPVVVGDEMYFVNDQGVASCAQIADGKILWSRRIAGNYSASPLAADGKIYFSSQDGKTTVIRPGQKYDELAVNQLEGQLMASPVVFEDNLVLRTATHLYRIGNTPVKAAAR